MTKAVFYKSEVFGLCGFKISGHSGYSEAGSDIICAAVSANTDLVMSLLEEAFKLEINVRVNEPSAETECLVLQSEQNLLKKDIVFALLDGYYNKLLELQKIYPKNICCGITERKGYHD